MRSKVFVFSVFLALVLGSLFVGVVSAEGPPVGEKTLTGTLQPGGKEWHWFDYAGSEVKECLIPERLIFEMDYTSNLDANVANNVGFYLMNERQAANFGAPNYHEGADVVHHDGEDFAPWIAAANFDASLSAELPAHHHGFGDGDSAKFVGMKNWAGSLVEGGRFALVVFNNSNQTITYRIDGVIQPARDEGNCNKDDNKKSGASSRPSLDGEDVVL